LSQSPSKQHRSRKTGVVAAAFLEPFLRQYQRHRATQRISKEIFPENLLLLRHDRYELTSFRRPFCPPCFPGIAIQPSTHPAAQSDPTASIGSQQQKRLGGQSQEAAKI